MSGTSNNIREQYSHYHKPCPYEYIDVYRVLELWKVSDPCLQHAIKKLLVAGDRGVKDIEKDVKEAIVTLNRWQQMQAEQKAAEDQKPLDVSTVTGTTLLGGGTITSYSNTGLANGRVTTVPSSYFHAKDTNE